MRNRLAQSPAAQIGVGLAIAALAQLLGLFLAGSGRKALLSMLLIAVIANGWLIKRTIDAKSALAHYLEVNGIAGCLIAALWIALWLFWQVMVVRTLFARSIND